MAESSLKVIRRSSKQNAALYATCADFCRIFAEDMKNLYLLALVLTADSEKAQQCFVSGLDDCTNTNQVFREWARSWARRVVIKRAIQMIAPGRERADQVLYPATKATQVSNAPGVPAEIAAVFELQDLERFTLVMSVFERYSDLDCALLLGCTRESLTQARVRALEQISNLRIKDSIGLNTGSFSEARGSAEELGLRVRLATPA